MKKSTKLLENSNHKTIAIKRDPGINGMKDINFNANARYFTHCPDFDLLSTSLFQSIPLSPPTKSLLTENNI